jgi:phosphoglycolate phosphatase
MNGIDPTRMRAVLFDLDGTLLDTLEDIARAFNRVLAARGLPTHDLSAYRYFVGDGARVLAARALPVETRTEAMIGACTNAYIDDYQQNPIGTARPYDGIPELLTGLTERNLKLAVLSNKAHAATLACVSGLLDRWHFEAVFGLREGIPRKPDPAGALEAARRISVPPDRCLFVGDTAIDMKTAIASGMVPIGVLWGFRTREELIESGARALLNRPTDLLDILDTPTNDGRPGGQKPDRPD